MSQSGLHLQCHYQNNILLHLSEQRQRVGTDLLEAYRHSEKHRITQTQVQTSCNLFQGTLDFTASGPLFESAKKWEAVSNANRGSALWSCLRAGDIAVGVPEALGGTYSAYDSWIFGLRGCRAIRRNLYQEMPRNPYQNARFSIDDFSKSSWYFNFLSKVPQRTAYKLSRAAMLCSEDQLRKLRGYTYFFQTAVTFSIFGVRQKFWYREMSTTEICRLRTSFCEK